MRKLNGLYGCDNRCGAYSPDLETKAAHMMKCDGKQGRLRILRGKISDEMNHDTEGAGRILKELMAG